MQPDYFTFNGKSYPPTGTPRAEVGERILFPLIGSGQLIHPTHIHGRPVRYHGDRGNPVPATAWLTLPGDETGIGGDRRATLAKTARPASTWAASAPAAQAVSGTAGDQPPRSALIPGQLASALAMLPGMSLDHCDCTSFE